MTLALRSAPRRRAISLTPMVDVVFLLLVFFMLAARFEQDVAIDLATTGGTAEGDAPRLVDILPGGVRLNGVAVADRALAERLEQLVPDASAIVVLRPAEGTDVQRLIDVAERLRDVGFINLAIVE